jgi:hypothetical protein
MALEEFKVFDVNILEILDFEEIEALLELGNTDYGENTCFDYIDSIKKKSVINIGSLYLSNL